jgi:hypothetical protein
MEKVLTAIANSEATGFAIIKYYDSINYYSPLHPEKMKAEGDLFSYKIAEIVGWRNHGSELTVRMGPLGWGYKGYGWVPENSPLIYKVFSVGEVKMSPATRLPVE